MYIVETRDYALIDHITVGLGLPPSSEYLPENGVFVLAAYDGGVAIAAAMVLESGMLDLPEVHLCVAKEYRGRATFAAVESFIEWLRVNRKEWPSLWTYVETTRHERFAKWFGFKTAFILDGLTHMYYPLNVGGES